MMRRLSVAGISRVRSRSAVLGTVALATVLASACSDGDPIGPGADEFTTLTVAAEEGWTYVALDDEARVVQVSDPSASANWDLAFFATGVMLNGGAAGPGGVAGHCLCQNASLTPAQIMALTPESQVEVFRAVTAAQIPPAGDAWSNESIQPTISGWFNYNPATHTVTAAANRAWIFRAANGTAFGKLRVASIEGAAQASPGRVTLEYAIQPQRGAPMGDVRTLAVDVPAGQKVYVSLTSGAVSSAANWDLMIDGFTIRANGGASGAGSFGAVLANEPFAAIASADDVPPAVFRGDAYGGVFDAHRWYHYDPVTHQIWPNYNVYLLRRGEAVYKVQLTGYYNTAGRDRHITFRVARLTG